MLTLSKGLPSVRRLIVFIIEIGLKSEPEASRNTSSELLIFILICDPPMSMVKIIAGWVFIPWCGLAGMAIFLREFWD